MKKIIIAACMALLGCGSVFAQQGKQAIGGNLSYGTEIESVGIGLKYQYNITDQIRIEPSMNYFFKNDGLSMFDINANIHYLFPRKRWRLPLTFLPNRLSFLSLQHPVRQEHKGLPVRKNAYRESLFSEYCHSAEQTV